MGFLGSEEEPQDGSKNRNVILIGIGIGIVCLAAILLTTESGQGVFGFFRSNSDETTQQEMAAAPLADSSVTLAETDTVEEEDEEDDESLGKPEEITESDEFAYTNVYLLGNSQKELAWRALNTIDEWRNTGQSDNNVMKQYLGHRKIWVRLAAFEVALKQQKLSEDELQSVALDLREGYRRDQMRRWLKRVRVRDAETWTTMTSLLGT
jgi:hypothetical protein